MITLATALKEGFNVYLAETGKVNHETGYAESYRLVMPNEDGTFPESVLLKRTGLAIKWPVNPHDTGESMILSILNANGLNVHCIGFGRDQNGRFFKC